MASDTAPWVLLVEDNPDHAALVMAALADADAATRVTHVADGERALALLLGGPQEAGGETTPALVLLDLRLPKIDGLEVLRQVKDDRRARFIPVVILSTSDAASDIVQAYTCHANSYIVKPLGFGDMRRVISQAVLYWSRCNRVP
jgi:CheY-like chemotaxis protein